jgi:hypothetical protein
MASDPKSEAMRTGYGDTGHPLYPYHPRHGADTYYPGRVNDDEMRSKLQEAAAGMRAIHAFAAAWACRGDTRVMRAWDRFNEELYNAGIVAFCTGRTGPYHDSIMRPDHPSRSA